MASRRMFSHAVITTDKFQSLSRDSQFLYIHLGMHADDDGFLGSPLMLAKMIACGKEELIELEKCGYILSFPSGVCVILHWNRNNYIQKDRYTETVYREEKAHLVIEDGVYRYCEEPRVLSDAEIVLSKPKSARPDTVVALAEPSAALSEAESCPANTNAQKEIDKGATKTSASVRFSGKPTQIVGESTKSVSSGKTEAKTTSLVLGAYRNVYLSQEEYDKLKREFPNWAAMIENLSRKIAMHGYRYKNHYTVLLEWAKQDEATNALKRAAPQDTRTSFRAQTMDTYLRMAEKIEKRQFEKTPQAVGG